MIPNSGNTTIYSGNHLGGNSINFLGNIHGNVSLPERRNDSQCLRDLRITDPRADMERIKHSKDELLTDCYAWIMKDPEFQNWNEQPHTKRLWIKGDPGKGKTMIMIGIINELLRSHKEHMASSWIPVLPNCVISYYFCESGRPEQNTAVAVLRGLIYMLVKQREELLHHVEKQYNIAGKFLFEDPNAIWSLKRILSDILKDPTLPRTYLLIDALDECSSDLRALLQIITDDAVTGLSDVKWLVTSRNLPHIERLLRANSLRTKISLELNSEHVSRAVSAFIRFKVKQLAESHKYDSNTEEVVERELNEKAQGTFLWVSLVCKELRDVPLWETKAVLKEIPRGLNSMYDRMLAHLKKHRPATVGLCIDILRSVALAFRPLRLEELIITAGLPDHLDAVRDLVAHCGSFVIILEDVVSFVHLSAQDYFISFHGKEIIFSAGEEEEHQKITIRLLDTLGRKLHRNMCGLQPETEFSEAEQRIDESVIPELDYACIYWVNHLAYSAELGAMLSDNGKVHEFLRKNVLYWIEAMTLMEGRHPFGSHEDIMSELTRMVQVVAVNSKYDVSEPYRDILCLWNDTVHFFESNRSVIHLWPLQLYYSALTFTTESSMIRRLFVRDIPESINCSFVAEEIHPFGKFGLSPRGDIIASLMRQSAILRHLKTRQLLQRFTGHTEEIACIAFSPQGNKAALALEDMTLRIWDAERGQLLHTCTGHIGEIACITFSGLGDRVASCSLDGSVRIWDVTSGQQFRALTGHTNYVYCVAFSPGGDMVVSASWDGTVRLWDVRNGRVTKILNHPMECTFKNYFGRLAFSLDGAQLVSGEGDEVRLWDTQTGALLQKFRTSASLSPDSPQICDELIIHDNLFVRTEDTGILSALQLKHILVNDRDWLVVDGKKLIRVPDGFRVMASTPFGRIAISNSAEDGLWILDLNCT